MIRCAIYCRKSTEEGLDSDFSSLDNQREAAESYIRSLKDEGWITLPERYNDGGYSGGSLERPALKKLLADCEAGKIDCIVTYKIDRLSRSLVDFVRLIDFLEKARVSFVAITQQFNSANSIGRLTLNILMSFAQFEREIIAERTRDKMSAARRKGKWTGGFPVLGYDPQGGKLLVNQVEAEQVREIFHLYLQHQSMMKVVRELNNRGWKTKSWVTGKGEHRLGKPFTTANLHRLLTNATYAGKIRHQGTLYPGEQEAIIDESLWNRVQETLRQDRPEKTIRNKHGVLLQGLVRCAHCNMQMFHTYSQKGNRRYRYYVCTSAQKQGYETCPARSVPAAEMEKFVVGKIREVGKDFFLLGKTTLGTKVLKNAFSVFDPTWEMLFPKERSRIVHLILENVIYDGAQETAEITFSPEGIKTLAEEVEAALKKEEAHESKSR